MIKGLKLVIGTMKIHIGIDKLMVDIFSILLFVLLVCEYIADDYDPLLYTSSLFDHLHANIVRKPL